MPARRSISTQSPAAQTASQAELRIVDFSGSFFETTSGGKHTKELISRCTALMLLSIPTVRQFGLNGGMFFASGKWNNLRAQRRDFAFENFRPRRILLAQRMRNPRAPGGFPFTQRRRVAGVS